MFRWLAGALVSLAFVAVACTGEAITPPDSAGGPTDPATTPSERTATSTRAPATIPEVLDFEAPLLDGGVLRGADLAGKDVAFWFWAPW